MLKLGPHLTPCNIVYTMLCCVMKVIIIHNDAVSARSVTFGMDDPHETPKLFLAITGRIMTIVTTLK